MVDANALIAALRFDENGLVPAIVQDADTQQVLMLGFMNADAVKRTLEENRVCFWSRSRQKFWIKGETSGMTLRVTAVAVNCEMNSLLVTAVPAGPTCHTGHTSCYYREAIRTEWTETQPVIISAEDLYKK
ncbi:MAG: phosphoribosyl-AMP cyclohydrolase [Armatimonadota bacterium]|jgi:phosphoribosyl-AMP cyclohydrolase